MGGRRKQRPISLSVITDIFDKNSVNQLKKGVVKSNLINVHPKPKPAEIKIRHLNTRSVRNKTNEISDNIIEDDIDLFFISESWLCDCGDEAKIADLTPSSYKFQHVPRLHSSGGIAVLYKNSLEVEFSNTISSAFPSLEFLNLNLIHGNHPIKFICIYLPPPSKTNKLTDSMLNSNYIR
ncbi:hypothetical protein SNE40_022069 [Patella caerulea]|uniref:Uncharacterized protein n=1 Tax=Patella caerulea TaxID=87958 RepID=A0AAN8G0X0_PATCE